MSASIGDRVLVLAGRSAHIVRRVTGRGVMLCRHYGLAERFGPAPDDAPLCTWCASELCWTCPDCDESHTALVTRCGCGWERV